MEDHLKKKDRLEDEWRSLCAYEAEPSARTIATLPANSKKNRLPSALPYDHSRVTLNAVTNATGGDYINASTITDHDPRNPAYIATQVPSAGSPAGLLGLLLHVTAGADPEGRFRSGQICLERAKLTKKKTALIYKGPCISHHYR